LPTKLRIVASVSAGSSERSSRGVGTGRRVAQVQVEEDGGGDDGHFCHAGVEADAAFFEVAHHPVGGGQPIGGATGQEHGVDLLHQVHRAQQIGLAGAGRAAPLIHPAHGPLLAQDDGAAGQPL
jgi:hypothetical protein